MHNRLFAAAAAASLAFGSLALAGAGPACAADAAWDGLVEAQSPRIDLVYLLPGADFRGYTKVMLDRPEVAFRRDWLRNYNSGGRGISSRISESELQRVIEGAETAGANIFAEAFAKGGYPVVTAPGADVLRVRTGVLNVSVRAPDRQTAGRSSSFAAEAGDATLVVEVRDSVSGEILGRAVDQRIAGDATVGNRSRSTNRADFRDLARAWAKLSVRGVSELKTLSPVNTQGASPQ
jgi:hypothetical protein